MSEVTRKVTVPDGRYCQFETRKQCEMLRTSFSHIGWEDGLGSPGTLTLHHCDLFHAVLGEEQIDGKGPWWFRKCETCLANTGGR